MATITPTEVTSRGYRVRSATAQASTGQTDWIRVPAWARFAKVYFDLTDVGVSTTPIFLPSIKEVTPYRTAGILVDTNAKYVSAVSVTGLTGVGLAVYNIGPGVTGGADDVTLGTSGGTAYINTVLPEILGFTVLNDRTTGDEVYTYTIYVSFTD